MSIKMNYLIEKRNVLNEIRANGMTLQELRFFSIYLAKINARDTSTRRVKFSFNDFQKIMELGRLNLVQLCHTVDGLLRHIVGITLEDGTHTRFQLFKKAVIYPDAVSGLCVEIDAHDDALPLMFEFKEKYFTYELWNALRLKSSNQIRMYEILKQYERIGQRTLEIGKLREMLGIEKNEHPRYNNFRTRVLDACQEALAMYTDIRFTFEPTGKKGPGGKIKALKFKIDKNENHVDKLSLSEFIREEEITDALSDDSDPENYEEESYFEQEIYPFMSEACENEFGQFEIQVLYNLIIKIIPYRVGQAREYQLELYDYLKRKYDELKWRASRSEISSRLGYLKKIIEADMKTV